MTEGFLAAIELGWLLLSVVGSDCLGNLHGCSVDAVASGGAGVPLGQARQIAAVVFLGLVDHVALKGPFGGNGVADPLGELGHFVDGADTSAEGNDGQQD